MSLRLNPFMRCVCGKLHIVSILSVTSSCSCGRLLWHQAWRR